MEKKEFEINPNQSKYDYLLECNKPYMDLTALTFANRKITYEEMHERINQYARALYKKGIREGDVIGVCVLNTPESVFLIYALDIIGAKVVGLNPFDSNRAKMDLELTKPKMVITVDIFYNYFKNFEKALNFSSVLYSPLESVDDLKVKIPYNLMQLAKGNFKLSKDGKLMSIVKDPGEELVKGNYQPGELTDIIFTGGSTGVHKGVELSDNGINNIVEGTRGLFGARPGMVELGHIPFGHMSYGRMILHYSLCNNMDYSLTLKAMPKDFYDELIRTQAQGAVGGPPHWYSLVEKTDDGLVVSSKVKKDSLKQLEYVTSGGEAFKSTMIKPVNSALEYAGSEARVGDGLGTTETWGVITVNNGRTHTPGTLGHKIHCADIKLKDPDTLEDVPDGEEGLLFISSPTVMIGYHNNPEETNKVLSYDENGKKWLNTGDILKKLDNGEYIYVGRKKRNFVSDVDNIYPEELEDALSSIPEIREAVVTPISDEMLQYVPRFHISLYSDDIDFKLLEQKINNLILSRFNSQWLPGSITYTTEPLERMSNSKVNISYYLEKDRRDLEENRLSHEDAVALRLKKK